MKWSEVLRIVTKKNEITNRVQDLNDAYETQRGAHEWREANLAKQLKEFTERESKLRTDLEALKIRWIYCTHKWALILAIVGISSMESLDFG